MSTSAKNRLQSVLDDVRPLVRAQDFVAVCKRLEAESEAAVRERRLSDAASFNAMLGSFRSIVGDEEAALTALEQAEKLEPANLHRRLSTARHLFARMHRAEEAARTINEVLQDERLDSVARHEGLALLGRLALHDARTGEATTLLSRACEAARAADLDAMLWDRDLAREMVDHQYAADAVRTYLAALIERAEVEGDEMTREEVLRIRDRLETPTPL